MNYLIRYYKRQPLDPQDRHTIHRETVTAKDEAEARDIIACCDCEVIDCTLQDAPLSVGDFDLDTIVTKDLEASHNAFMPPLVATDDYKVYNGKQEADMEPLSLPEPRFILSRSWADKHLNSDDDLKYFNGGAVIK